MAGKKARWEGAKLVACTSYLWKCRQRHWWKEEFSFAIWPWLNVAENEEKHVLRNWWNADIHIPQGKSAARSDRRSSKLIKYARQSVARNAIIINRVRYHVLQEILDMGKIAALRICPFHENCSLSKFAEWTIGIYAIDKKSHLAAELGQSQRI
jgi:hypothetical protein